MIKELPNNERDWLKYLTIDNYFTIFQFEHRRKIIVDSGCDADKILLELLAYREENKNIIVIQDWVYKFDIEKVRKNARIRTKIRTWVEILEEYNKNPLVDWVFMENTDENGEVYYKLVCLMHFIVKKYTWNLWYTNNESC